MHYRYLAASLLVAAAVARSTTAAPLLPHLDFTLQIDRPVYYVDPDEVVVPIATLTNLPTSGGPLTADYIPTFGFSAPNTLLFSPIGLMDNPYLLDWDVEGDHLPDARSLLDDIVLAPGESVNFSIATFSPAESPVALGTYSANFVFTHFDYDTLNLVEVSAETALTFVVVPEPTTLLITINGMWLVCTAAGCRWRTTGTEPGTGRLCRKPLP